MMCPSGLKRREIFQRVISFSSKANISDGMGCLIVYVMGSLHVLEGTYEY